METCFKMKNMPDNIIQRVYVLNSTKSHTCPFQNSKIFWYIMMLGVAGVATILMGIAWVRGNLDSWHSENLIHNGYKGV